MWIGFLIGACVLFFARMTYRRLHATRCDQFLTPLAQVQTQMLDAFTKSKSKSSRRGGKSAGDDAKGADGESIVTAIEILSPANKLKGSASRTLYLSKRRDLLRSEAHFIEIDLPRGGNRTEPAVGMGQAEYLIWLSRSQDRTKVDYWPTALESPLPTIPVPLLPGDSDVPLNVQAVFHDVYDRSGYVRRMNYSQPVPAPPLAVGQIEGLKGIAQALPRSVPVIG